MVSSATDEHIRRSHNAFVPFTIGVGRRQGVGALVEQVNSTTIRSLYRDDAECGNHVVSLSAANLLHNVSSRTREIARTRTGTESGTGAGAGTGTALPVPDSGSPAVLGRCGTQ